MECKEITEPMRNRECSSGKPWNSLGFPSKPSGQAQPRPLAPWVFRSCCPAGFLAWGAKRACPGGCLGVGKGWLRPELSQVPIRGCFLQKSMREYLCPKNQIFWLKSPEVQGPRRNTPARRPDFFLIPARLLRLAIVQI